MIPENFIEAWRMHAQWQNAVQVEQDLIISRALVDLYHQPYVQDALVFRGGTALNKLFLKPPARYSEDLDFVQKRAEPIGKTLDSIKAALKPWLGDPAWKITQRSAKLIYPYKAVNGLAAKLKIEINTTEHFRVLPLRREDFAMRSEWFQGQTHITTYEIDELIATKLRAVYQRRKGRDLFDLWYVLSQNLVNLNRVIDVFHTYCAHDELAISGKQFRRNLNLKRQHKDFQSDMNVLLPRDITWNFDEAFEYVLSRISHRLP